MAYTYKGVTYLSEGEWTDDENYDKYYSTYRIPTFSNFALNGADSYYLEAPRSAIAPGTYNSTYIAKFPREVAEAMQNYFYVGPGYFSLVVDGENIGTYAGHDVVYPKYRNQWGKPEREDPIDDVVIYYTTEGLWDGYKVVALNNEIYGGKLFLVPDTGDYHKNVMLTLPYLDNDIRTEEYFKNYAKQNNVTDFDPYQWWRDYVNGNVRSNSSRNSNQGYNSSTTQPNGETLIELDDVIVVGRPNNSSNANNGNSNVNNRRDNQSRRKPDVQPTQQNIQEQPENTLRLIDTENLGNTYQHRLVVPTPTFTPDKNITVRARQIENSPEQPTNQPTKPQSVQQYLENFHRAINEGSAVKADPNSEHIRRQLDDLHKAIRQRRTHRLGGRLISRQSKIKY